MTKIAVFTCNQPRHLSLIEKLASVADEVFAVQECNTVFPGKVADFFHKSDVMQTYFSQVIAAEQRVFGELRLSPPNVRHLSVKMGDVSDVDLAVFGDALNADLFVVFGASYIKGRLVEALVERRAVNIHMGVSPFYRGSSCNFWALYDGNADLVGATIHRLSKGLDSGAILFHALPRRGAVEPFEFGMQAVRAAHEGLVAAIGKGDLLGIEPVASDRAREIRYTRNADFSDAVAAEYLDRKLSPADIDAMLAAAPERTFVRPVIL